MGVFKYILKRSICNLERFIYMWYLIEGVYKYFCSIIEIYICILIIRVEFIGILRLLKY